MLVLGGVAVSYERGTPVQRVMRVAKIFKARCIDKWGEDKIYFDEAVTQTVANVFAKAPPSIGQCPRLKVVKPTVLTAAGRS